MFHTSLTKLSAVTFLALGLSAPVMAQTVNFRVGHTSPAAAESDDHVASLALKEFIERESGGEISVRIFPAQQLGNAQQMVEQVNSGALDLVNTAALFLAPFLPELAIVEMPYLLDNDQVAEKFAKGPIVGHIRTEMQAKLPNVYVANLFNTGNWRSFYTSKPVQTAADLKGLKIRTVPAPLSIEFIKALGAQAVPLGWGDVYPSLQSGLIQGTGNAATDIVPAKLNEVVKFAIIDRHSYLLGANLVSKSFLDKLSPKHRDIVERGLAHMAETQTKFNVSSEAGALERFKASGGTVVIPTAAQLATFTPVRETIVQWYKNTYGANGDKWIAAFQAAVAEARK